MAPQGRNPYSPRMRRIAAGITAAAIVVLSVSALAESAPATSQAAGSAGSAGSAGCDPVSTKPVYRGTVPSPTKALGYKFGSREATDQEIGKYWDLVGARSARVVTGVYAHSWEGRPLRYALVGTPTTLHRLPAIRHDLARLRDPATPAAQAAAIVRRTPNILWITANVHGNEPSGGDAVVRLLYSLADRSDCVARAILDNTLVGLIPVQNPDGRQHSRRYNAAAFDMNRDVLVGTQPEVAGRLALFWKYPPQLVVDEHENSGRNYFFPPNADPVYHETPNRVYDEILNIYGPANEAAFDANGWKYETSDSGYDFFAQEYGDTVPTTQMGAAGMTYEQGDYVRYPMRVRHQFTTGLVSLYAGATHRESILQDWRATFVNAKAEGAQCRLERNRIYNPGHQAAPSGAGPAGLRILPAGQLAGDPPRRAPAADRARHRPEAAAAHGRGGLQALRASAPAGHAAGRHLLGHARPGAEALGAGGAQREHVRAVPVLLRRQRVEPPAARRGARRLDRDEDVRASAHGRSGRCACAAEPAASAAADRRTRPVREDHQRLPEHGLAEVAADA